MFYTYSKLYNDISDRLGKKQNLHDFVRTNQDKIIDDNNARDIFLLLFNYAMPANKYNSSFETFRESDQYKILEIIFTDRFDFCVALPITILNIVKQNYSDAILDLFLQNRSRVTDEIIRYVHMLGTYEMVKLVIEKYKKEPSIEQIKNVISGFNGRSITDQVKKYYMETYIGTISDTKFLYNLWYNYYSSLNFKPKEIKECFMRNLLNRDNLRNIVVFETWKTWDCYVKYMKRIVLTLLKRHRINYTLIGELNDVGQLCRIINGFL